MIRKILTLLLISAAFIGLSACELPSSVEVKVGLGASLPIGSNNGDVTSIFKGMIDDVLNDAKGEEGEANVRIVNYKDYPKINGKDVQTFLIQYNLFEKVDFSDGLEDFTSMFDKFEKFDLDFGNLDSIDLQQMNTMGGNREEVKISIIDVLNKTESTLESEIRKCVADEDINVPLLVGIGSGSSNVGNPFTMNMGSYEEIKFKTGKLTIDLSIDLNKNSPNKDESGVDFYFTGVQIRDGATIIDGKDEDGNTEIGFSEFDYMKKVVFDLDGKTLSNNFFIEILEVVDNTPSKMLPINYDLSLSMPDVKAVIRSVMGFVIPEDDPIEAKVEDWDFPIDLDEKFLNAQIENGKILIEIKFPERPVYNQEQSTWINLHNDYETNIFMKQNDVNDSYGNWEGLNGTANGFWKYFEGENNLRDCNFNAGTVYIGNDSKIVLTGKLDFNLSDAGIDDKEIKVDITPKITLNKFSVLNLKNEDLLEVTPPDPIDLGDAVNYLKEITFSQVGVILKVGDFDVDGLSVMISIPALEVNQERKIESGTDLDFTKENYTLKIRDENDNLQIRKIEFEVEIGNDSDNHDVLQLKNIDLTKEKIELDIKPIIFFKDNWTEAKVDMSHMDTEKSFSIDALTTVNKNLTGFSFDYVDAYLYIDGHQSLFDMQPAISLRVEYDGVISDTPLHDGEKLTFKRRDIPEIGDEFSGVLPEGEHIYIGSILNNPQEGKKSMLYSISLAELKMTPARLDELTGGIDSDINISLFIILPMCIKAGKDGGSIVIPNMFNKKDEEGKPADMFGRKGEEGDFSFTEIIKNLNLNISLNDNTFNGGTLYMRRENETPESANLNFDLSGKSLNLSITGKILDEINKNIPYVIEEMGIKFKSNTELIIPSSLLVQNIAFNAEVIYETKFEF